LVGLELNGTRHLLVYADVINTCGENLNTVNKHTEPLLEASNEVGLEANTEQVIHDYVFPPKFITNHNLLSANKPFEKM
jgi:hypothetical protein